MNVRTIGAFLFTFLVTTGVISKASASADWTIIVFMNAKNNLEQDALDNFNEIAGTGSTSQVNILVEMGRPAIHYTTEAGAWSGVLRFKVAKGQEPIPAEAVLDLRDKPDLSDLGSKEALQNFVTWAIQNYPARNYMLVIWNHGQGWRFQMAREDNVRAAAGSRSPVIQSAARVDLTNALQHTPQLGGFRAVSFDQDTNHFLYNSDIQGVTESTTAALGRPLDIVGFDACLMSMLETAYALRSSSALLVASEELEPGAGWDYSYFLSRLVSKPSSTPFELSRTITDAYRARYGDVHNTTLSILDLAQAKEAAGIVSQFADVLSAKLALERRNIEAARAQLTTYGAGDGLKTSIDFIAFIDAYLKQTKDVSARDAAISARNALLKLVKLNYASALSMKKTGSNGVAIYFPATKADFISDPYHDGYMKDNAQHVVQFVSDEHWADFLHSFLQ